MIVMTPVISQTSRRPPGPQGDICRPMSAETMKIPEPIIDPTTSEIAARGPMPRMNSEGGVVAAGALVGAAIAAPGSGYGFADSAGGRSGDGGAGDGRFDVACRSGASGRSRCDDG